MIIHAMKNTYPSHRSFTYRAVCFFICIAALFASPRVFAQTNAQSSPSMQTGTLYSQPDPERQQAKEQGTLSQPDLSVPFDGDYVQVNPIIERSNSRLDGCWISFDPALWTQFPANDDGSAGPINLPFTFDLYGTSYTSLYLNNNGNITFDNALSWYSASGFPITTPMIAPFWGDVDTRSDHGEVWYYVDDNAFYATWVEVGPYSAYSSYSTGLFNSFQVVITDGTDPVLSAGQNIGFAYGEMGWTTGSASGGSNGFGGTAATVGVNFGDGENFIQMGLFDSASDDYDGPTGGNDGVAWLSNQCFEIDAATPGNTPPIAQGFPENNTLYTCTGVDVTQTFSFLDMDPGESVSISIDDQGNGGYSIISNTSGAPASAEITFNHSTAGSYTYVLTGTDNNYSPAATDITVTLVVSASPSITVNITQPSCAESNGQIAFVFSDNPNQSEIQFSLDGGVTWETAVNDNSGSATYSNLAPGSYQLATRWQAGGCEVDLGSETFVDSGFELASLSCSGDLSVNDAGNDCEESVSVPVPTLDGGCSEIDSERNYLTFDGSNDYIAIENFNYSGTQAELSVEAWIRTSDGTNQIIASFDRSEFWRLEINGSGGDTGEVGWSVTTNSGILDMGSNTRVDDGQWHHIVGIYDNGTVAIYIDGTLDASTTHGTVIGNTNTRYGFIATGSEADSYDGNTGPSDYFNGDIAGIRIWDKALAAVELNSEYCPNLLAEDLAVNYDFTEGTGIVLNDASGNSNNGNFQNMTASAWANGSAPGCITFFNDFNQTADASGIYGGGETIVNWTYSAPNGQSNTCSQTIEVVVPAELVCENQFNDYIWNGSADSDWNNAANWVGNEVPPSQANVMIAVTNFPPELSQTVSVNNILIDENSSIAFSNSSGQVKIYGDLANNGTLHSTAGKFWFAGDDLQLIKGANAPTFYELKISSTDTVRLLTNIFLNGALQPNSGVFDWNDKSVELLSTADYTGSIGEIKSSAEILGTEILYNRYFPAAPGSWRMLCSPIVNAAFDQWNDDLPTTGFTGSNYPNYPSAADPWSNIRRYDETVTEGDLHSGFESISNVTDVIGNSNGYFVYFIPNSTTIDMSGEFHKGDLTYSLSRTVSNTDPYNDGWNLIANPYPSAIDWDETLGWTKSDIDDAIYAFDPESGQYASYINGISVGQLDNRVASFQAFWVKANGPNPEVVIKESAKSNAGGVFMRSQDLATQTVIRLKVLTDDPAKYDETVIGLRYGAEMTFESNLDAYKFFGNNPALPSLASVSDSINNRPLSISMIPVPEEDMVIELLVRPGNNAELTLKNTQVDSYDGNICLQLEDRALEITVAFNLGDSYSFACSEDMLENRFALHVSAPVDATPFHENCPEAENGSIIVQGFGDAPWSFTWTDEMGNVFREMENLYTADTAEDLPPGFYDVLVENTDPNCSSSSAYVQVHAASTPFIEKSSTPASCNQENDGTISFFGAEDYDWDITLTSYEDNSITQINAVNGDSTVTGLLYGVYLIDAVSNCGTVIDIENADLRDDNAVESDFIVLDAQISLSNGEVATFLEQCSQNVTAVRWDFGDGVVDSLNFNPSHSFTEAGLFYVNLTASNADCEGNYEMLIVVTGILPNDNETKEDMSGFEASELGGEDLTVVFTAQEIAIQSSSDVNEPVFITIFNLNGQLVQAEQLPELTTGQTNVNISSLQPGMYSMSITTTESLLYSEEFAKN